MAHPFTHDDGDRCQCGQFRCSPLHEPRGQHHLVGSTSSMFSGSTVLVICGCGEQAQYDTEWGQLVVPSSLWRRVEREMQDRATV
jgi:hypothetical protein